MTTSTRVVNLPNLLTTLRLVLVPVFLLVLFSADGQQPLLRWLAGAVFAAAAITDRYDGRIARQRGQVTNFGKIADPIADKALISAALIGLSLLGEIFWWVTVVILTREIGITVMRFTVIHRRIIPASRGGKVKTLIQIVAIGLYVLPLTALGLPHMILTWGRGGLMAVAIALTISTGVDYVVKLFRPVGRGT